jgi:hypothetical protein
MHCTVQQQQQQQQGRAANGLGKSVRIRFATTLRWRSRLLRLSHGEEKRSIEGGLSLIDRQLANSTGVYSSTETWLLLLPHTVLR